MASIKVSEENGTITFIIHAKGREARLLERHGLRLGDPGRALFMFKESREEIDLVVAIPPITQNS